MKRAEDGAKETYIQRERVKSSQMNAFLTHLEDYEKAHQINKFAPEEQKIIRFVDSAKLKKRRGALSQRYRNC